MVSQRTWLPIAAVMAIAAVLLVAAIIVYPLPVTTPSSATLTTTSSPPTGVAPLSATNYNSSLGLLLTLNISEAVLPQDDGISMDVSLANTLPTMNNLSATLEGLTSFGDANYNVVPFNELPIGVHLLRGNYALSNLSEGQPLFPYTEPFNGRTVPPHSLSFAPASDNFTYVGEQYGPSPSVEASAGAVYWGYWNWTGPVPLGQPSTKLSFQAFPPGVYTLEGEDWWGQATLLHFQVVPNGSPIDCAAVGSNSSFVASTNFSVSAGPMDVLGYYHMAGSNSTAALELSTTGSSAVKVDNPYTQSIQFGFGPFLFNPNASLVQTFRSFAPNGTLSYPITLYPGECSLVILEFQPFRGPFAGFPLLFDVGNQTQTVTLDP
jgi:hypothetical protein